MPDDFFAMLFGKDICTYSTAAAWLSVLSLLLAVGQVIRTKRINTKSSGSFDGVTLGISIGTWFVTWFLFA